MHSTKEPKLANYYTSIRIQTSPSPSPPFDELPAMEMMVSILSDLISSTIKLLSEEHVPSVRSLWSWPPTSDDNDDADEEVTVVIGMGSVSVRPSRGGVKTTGIYSSASRGNFEFLKCCFNASKPCSHFQTSYFKNNTYIFFFWPK